MEGKVVSFICCWDANFKTLFWATTSNMLNFISRHKLVWKNEGKYQLYFQFEIWSISKKMSKQILILFISFIIFGAESKPANLRPIFIGKLRFINPRLILKLTKSPFKELVDLQKSIQKPTKSGMYFVQKILIWIFALKIKIFTF